jgi:hypothetical protein
MLGPGQAASLKAVLFAGCVADDKLAVFYENSHLIEVFGESQGGSEAARLFFGPPAGLGGQAQPLCTDRVYPRAEFIF